MKLGLGTVQFGTSYGIANRQGQVPATEVDRILRRAERANIDLADTAVGYGDAEQRLGEAGVTGWRVVSKLPQVPARCGNVGAWVETNVRASLERLRVERLYGLLLHRPEQLLHAGGEEIYRALQGVRLEGLVQRIGISIYDPSELDALRAFPIDLVQAPFNLLDRRLIRSGWMARLANTGTELHVRSVFLQGLLLMRPRERPPSFDRWSRLWTNYDQWLAQVGLTALQACLRDALSLPQVAAVIVGVDRQGHLEEILRAAEGPPPDIPDSLRIDDPDLLNPSRWGAPGRR